MIPKEEIMKLESLLKEEKEIIEKEIGGLGGTDFGSDIDHNEEESDESEEITTQEGVTHPLKDRLKDINLALDKIGAGAYGVCENCGKDISLDLLKVDPESRLCKECKNKEEEVEK